MAIVFERLVGRNVSRFVSSEVDLAGLKLGTETFLSIAIIGWILVTFIVSAFMILYLKFSIPLAFVTGLGSSALYEVMLYAFLEFMIEQRRTFVEELLPDYLQLVSASIRSGIPASKAMATTRRPEFKYFDDDLSLLEKQLFSGETVDNALRQLGSKYRSLELRRTLRMIIEATQYGGGMADLLNQIARDLRNRQIVQKEISGQLFMYSIFIAFAAIIGSPVLYALTSQMIRITVLIWSKINLSSISSVSSVSSSFLHFSKPQITTNEYFYFALSSIMITTAFCAFIMSTISSGSSIKGLRYMPIFIIAGILIFFIVSAVVGSLFTSIGAA